jgi:hypothetical protein
MENDRWQMRNGKCHPSRRLPSAPAVCSFLYDKLCSSQMPLSEGSYCKPKKPQCEVHTDANQPGFVGNTRLPRLQG